MNVFLYWSSFYWKKYGTYISHELIVQREFDTITIYLQYVKFGQQLTNCLSSFNFVSLKHLKNLKALCCRALF